MNEKTNSDTSSKFKKLEDARVRLSSRLTISLTAAWKLAATIFALVAATAGITTQLVHRFELSPITNLLEKTNATLIKERKTIVRLTHERNALENSLTNIAKQETSTLLLPANSSHEIGGSILLEWRHSSKVNDNRSTIEYIVFNETNNTYRKFKKSYHERRSAYLDFGSSPSKIFWRVRPGLLQHEELFSQNWSAYNQFSFYPNVINRVKSQRTLTVGVTPLAVGPFNNISSTGSKQGFDVDLASWIRDTLQAKWKKTITLKFIDLPWRRLIPSVEGREIDMAIAPITITRDRQERHRSIMFSRGVMRVHQIFVGSIQKSPFPDGLQGRKIGVEAGTTNEKVAKYLTTKFNYQIVDKYRSYGEIIRAIERNEIDFGVMDDVISRKYLRGGIEQYGPNLDEYLDNFYKSVFGTSTEQYGVVLPREIDPKTSFGGTVDRLLASSEGMTLLKKLNSRWGKAFQN